MIQDFSLTGKTALVTGGGKGIGFGLASGILEAGARIACVYNSHEPIQLVEKGKGLGIEVFPIKANLEEEGEPERAFAEAVKHFGKIDILVNNSGICPRSSALEYPREMWDRIIRLNETVVFILSQLAARHFVENGIKGKIISVASMMSYLGGFNTTGYTASKHAVMGLTRVFASEWAKYGICVNAVAPGWIKTDLSKALREDKERDASVKARIPMGDWGDPEDFKGVAAFLASSASDYITGVTIPVDGGYLTK